MDAVSEQTGISEGTANRALMLRDSTSDQSFAARMKLAFYKLTWRTPLHQSKLNGKVPLRLLATPIDTLPADPALGKALMLGKFRFHGMEHPATGLDYERMHLPPNMVAYIHRFDWLRDLAAATDRGQGAPIAAKVASCWIEGNSNKTREPAWSVQNCAWRMLNMAAWAPYLLSSADPVYRSSIINHIARNARHLDRSAPRGGSRQQRLSGWAGVVAASLLLPEGDTRRLVGEDGLARAIDECIFPDGGIISRAPQQLMEIIGLFSLLRQSYLAVNADIPEFLNDALIRMVPALLGLTHADGGLGAWQGAGHISAQAVSTLVEASGVRTRPHRQALDWGYQRVTAGHSVLLVDAGPPPLAKQFISGCASTLALEFSHGDHRIFVNCGGAGLVGAAIPASLARGLRTTAAHSTLCIEDTNSTAILPGGQLGKGVEEVGLSRRDVDKTTRIEMTHDGYARNFGFMHSRLLIMRSDGLELRGEDILLPVTKGRPKENQICQLRFHIGPNIEISAGQRDGAAILRLADGSSWLFAAGSGALSIDESLWVDEYGMPHPGQQLIIQARTDKGGLTLGWQMRFIG